MLDVPPDSMDGPVSTTMAAAHATRRITVGEHAGAREGRRRRWPWLVGILVIVLGAGGGLQGLGWIDHWRGTDTPATPPPAPLSIRRVAAVSATTPAAAQGTADPQRVRRALAGPLGDDRLGDHVVAEVAGLTGAPVYSRGSGAVTPASTLKLLTTVAALHTLGPSWQGTTTATLTGGTVTLTGHGDVLLSHTDLADLATQTAARLAERHLAKVTVRTGPGYAGPATSPQWPASYVPEGVVTPIVPLWVDEGHTAGPDGVLGTEDDGRVADPTREALDDFAADLVKHGIKVRTGRPGRAGATVLATHTGVPLEQVVAHILDVSDNEGAETLAHLMGGSFAGGVTATEKALTQLGIPTQGLHLYDASGLSRDDRVPVPTLVAALQRAAADPQLAGVIEGLPVAGWSGSLAGRFTGDATAARGVAHAKTGTLTGVSNLAGTVTTADGVPLVVVIAADRITDTVAARDALDDALAALARCACR
jgi:serine-type D-Ala-D-Ala carboxypeptidase/endopeptidase (penicillin-binding protein 4)